MFRGAFVFLFLSSTAADAGCSEDRLQIRGPWGQAEFSVEIADTVEERSQGLMFRDEMARGAGMLFVYESPQSVAFWMRNTLIPLDMIFADATGTVRRTHENAIPHDETPIPGGAGIQYVFETNSGIVGLYGISKGSEIRHPSIISDSAAWPCG